MPHPRQVFPFVLMLLACMAAFGSPASAQYPELSQAPEIDKIGAKDVAVIVGVEKYFVLPDIDGVAQTVNDWEAFFVRGLGLPSSQVFINLNKDGTREKMLRVATRAAKTAKPGGKLWFIFIGHGAPTVDGTDGVLVGADAQSDPELLASRGVKRSELLAVLEKGKQSQTVVVIDACFSGKSSTETALAKGMQPVIPDKLTKIKPKSSTLVLSAASADQFAGALPGADRPAFSYVLLGGLRGWADDGDGKVTAQEAIYFARQQLRHLEHDQTPQIAGKGELLLASGAKETAPSLATTMRSSKHASQTNAPNSSPNSSPNKAGQPKGGGIIAVCDDWDAARKHASAEDAKRAIARSARKAGLQYVAPGTDGVLYVRDRARCVDVVRGKPFNEAASRLGVIDLQRALSTVAEGDRVEARVGRVLERHRKSLKAKRNEIERLEDRVATLSGQERKRAVKRLQQEEEELKKLYSKANREVKRSRAAASKLIIDKMAPLIAKIARRRNIELVYDRDEFKATNLLYRSDDTSFPPEAVDLTEQVIEAYDRLHP